MGWLSPQNPPLPPWSESHAWVVGASYGIGAALAEALLARGAHVALSARSERKLRAIADRYPDRASVEPLDFTDVDAVERAWASIRARWPRVDLVLVVAGTHQATRAWELNAGAARDLLETNLNGPIATVAAVVRPLLEQQRGAIGIVASLAGYRGLPKALVYGASKAALINFSEALYLDLAPRNLGVYLINPGFVDTPLTAKNDFRMPHIISASQAAESIMAGMERGAFEIDFPKALSRKLKLLRLLPYRLYFAAVRRATGL
jgi:short-subunit dehydrogenase